MHQLKWLAPFLSASLCIPLASGCGDGQPTVDKSKAEAKVSGVVKFQGKTVSGGQIDFNPSNVERQVGAYTAKIGPDGTYSVTTLIGNNAVRFSGPFLAGRPDIAMWTKVVEVTQGDNSRDFDILGENDLTQGPNYPAQTREKGNSAQPKWKGKRY
jgi:hypothetical protein